MKVLLIGPYAPHGQVGALRIISLSRYLVQKGYDVSVLCLSMKSLSLLDPNGLVTCIPEGIQVINYDLRIGGRGLLRQNYNNTKDVSIVLKELLENDKFDVILVSGGPFYTFPAMRRVYKAGIPYIVDYRDLHITSAAKRKRNTIVQKLKFWISYPLRYQQEYCCVKHAALVTVVYPDMAESLQKYFCLKDLKTAVIYNGYDDARLKDLSVAQKADNVFRIGYFGKLMYYNKGYTTMLFQAIEKLVNQNYIIEFLHIGPVNPAIEEYFNREDINGSSWYTCTDFMEYRQGMELLGSCDAFALEYALPEGPGTKIFDYIFFNKPVIGITKPGISLEKMLQEFENSYICHSEQDVIEAIKEIINKKIRTLVADYKVNKKVEFYARSKQNEAFVKLLKEIAE